MSSAAASSAAASNASEDSGVSPCKHGSSYAIRDHMWSARCHSDDDDAAAAEKVGEEDEEESIRMIPLDLTAELDELDYWAMTKPPSAAGTPTSGTVHFFRHEELTAAFDVFPDSPTIWHPPTAAPAATAAAATAAAAKPNLILDARKHNNVEGIVMTLRVKAAKKKEEEEEEKILVVDCQQDRPSGGGGGGGRGGDGGRLGHIRTVRQKQIMLSPPQQQQRRRRQSCLRGEFSIPRRE